MHRFILSELAATGGAWGRLAATHECRDDSSDIPRTFGAGLDAPEHTPSGGMRDGSVKWRDYPLGFTRRAAA